MKDLHNTKIEIDKARENVSLARSEVRAAKSKMARVQIRADGRKIPSIKDLAEIPPLPKLAVAKNKTSKLENQLVRLEDPNKVCQALIPDASNLRTDMADSLINCRAYLS